MNLVQIFKESKELKRFIYQRSRDNDIPLRYLCGEAGLKYQAFMAQYINVVGISKIEVTESQIKKLLQTLGVSVKFSFIVDQDQDMKEVSKELARKYQIKADKERAKDINESKDKRNTTIPEHSNSGSE